MQSYESKLKAIERRRWHLWTLAFTVIILFASTIAALSYWSGAVPDYVSELMNLAIIRFSLVALSLAFCIYILEKELIFKKVSTNLIDEKVKVETLHHEVKQVESLLNASKAINSVLAAKSVLDIILKSVTELLGADHASIMLYNEFTGLLEIANYVGMDPIIARQEKIKIGEGIAGKVFKTGKPEIINEEPGSKFVNVPIKQKPINSAMCVPLKAGDKVRGVICVSHTKKGSIPFLKEDVKTLLLFGEQAAIAIQNANLYEESKLSGKNLLKLNEELKKKNMSLKKYISDLKNANLELERFNNLVVNRELAMVKLKEKIKQLESIK